MSSQICLPYYIHRSPRAYQIRQNIKKSTEKLGLIIKVDRKTGSRICKICKQSKPVKSFYSFNNHHCGRVCSPCCNEVSRQGRKSRRLKIFKKIQELPQCARCGCDDLRFLEINHKNGGGGKEITSRHPYHFYNDIFTGKRKTDDLEILCRPCNHIHYLELKYGEIPLKVVFDNRAKERKDKE